MSLEAEFYPQRPKYLPKLAGKSFAGYVKVTDLCVPDQLPEGLNGVLLGCLGGNNPLAISREQNL